MLQALLGFAVCAVLIFFSGRKLSAYGDIIADHLGLGKAWVGLIMLASVTSLPELVVGISSVTIAESADLATGDVLGSCAFNLLILSLLDIIVKDDPVFARASKTHIMAGSMGMILVAMAGLGLFLTKDILLTPWISIVSLAFMVIYFLAIRLIYAHEKDHMVPEIHAGRTTPGISLAKALTMYTLHAVFVVAAALFLPGFAQTMAIESGLGESFVATLFLAAATSFPEMAVSFSAARMGMIDLAVGNLLGSNMFNFLILAVDDVFYAKGPLLKDASDSHLISVFSVMIMTAIAIAGIAYHNTQKKRFLMAADSFLILLTYIFNLVLLYRMSG
jgi:cation:H+ antiporter